MANNKFIEYRDPINSSDLNKVRAILAPPGRYLGFNNFTQDDPGNGNLGIRVYHSDTSEEGVIGHQSITGIDNSSKKYGAIITRQGVVITKEITDPLVDGVYIEFIPSSAITYYVFYVSYKWVQAEGGFTPTYGVYTFTPSNPLAIDPADGLAFPEYEVDLGYFTVYDSYSSIKYTPNPTPQFAWNNLPVKQLARLNSPNEFLKTNSWNYDYIPVDAASGMISLPNTGNSFFLQFSEDTHISLLGSGNKEGTIYNLVFMNYGKTVFIETNAIIGLPKTGVDGGVDVYEAKYGDILTLLQTDSNEFRLLSMWPVPIPQIDTSGLAKLKEVNKFTKTQYWQAQSLSDTDVVSGVLTLNQGNIVELTLNSQVSISSIGDSVSSNSGSFVVIHIVKASNSVLTNSGNIDLSVFLNDSSKEIALIPLQDSQTLLIGKVEVGGVTKWRLLSVWPISIEDTWYNTWVSITPPSDSTFQWAYLEYKVLPHQPTLYYIRGRFKALIDINPGTTGYTIPLPTSSNHYFTFPIASVSAAVGTINFGRVVLSDLDTGGELRLDLISVPQDTEIIFNGLIAT